MAKIIPRDIFDWRRDAGGNRYIPSERGRAKLKRQTKWVALRSDVKIIRTGGAGDKAFEACISIGGLRPGRVPTGGKTTSGFSHACKHGRNPRRALVAALQRFARMTAKREGAFYGGK